jgi:hypothetical protein
MRALHGLLQPVKEGGRQGQLVAASLPAIKATGVLAVDLCWLNANYQRALSRRPQVLGGPAVRGHSNRIPFLTFRERNDWSMLG